MNREQAILKLTKHELIYAIENPDQIDAVTKFFADGGFNKCGDFEIEDYINHFFGENA